LDRVSPERELAQRILAGDDEALRVFYDGHLDRLYHFVLSRVDGSRHEAEEIVQETFMACLHALPRFDGRSTLYSWLCSIAKHKVVDSRRQRTRRARVEIPLSQLEMSSEGLTGGVDGHRALGHHEELAKDALLALPAHYQSVLTRKYVEERTTRDIAREVGQTPKAVESLLTRARNAFRRVFDTLVEQDSASGS
jgi:RNA polymerase sigma-70 factor (ECF subfamily)